MNHATAAHCHRLSRQFPSCASTFRVRMRARTCACAPACMMGNNHNCRDSARQCATVNPVNTPSTVGHDVGPRRGRRARASGGTPNALAAHGPTSPKTARSPDAGGLWVSGQGRAANRYFPALLASRCPREQPQDQTEFVSPVREPMWAAQSSAPTTSSSCGGYSWTLPSCHRTLIDINLPLFDAEGFNATTSPSHTSTSSWVELPGVSRTRLPMRTSVARSSALAKRKAESTLLHMVLMASCHTLPSSRWSRSKPGSSLKGRRQGSVLVEASYRSPSRHPSLFMRSHQIACAAAANGSISSAGGSSVRRMAHLHVRDCHIVTAPRRHPDRLFHHAKHGDSAHED